MLNLVNIENGTKGNFWKLNPKFRIPRPYNSLYEQDDSKNKTDSSYLMWSIYAAYDYETIYSNLPRKARVEMSERDILIFVEGFEKALTDVTVRQSKWIKDIKGEGKYSIDDLINLYNDLQKSNPLRYIESHRAKMDERRKYLESKPYGVLDPEEAIHLDKMIENTSKLLAMDDIIIEKAKKEMKEAQIKGGYVPSLLENGVFN